MKYFFHQLDLSFWCDYYGTGTMHRCSGWESWFFFVHHRFKFAFPARLVQPPLPELNFINRYFSYHRLSPVIFLVESIHLSFTCMLIILNLLRLAIDARNFNQSIRGGLLLLLWLYFIKQSAPPYQQVLDCAQRRDRTAENSLS